MQNLKKVQICAKLLHSFLPAGFSPQVGLVLGTGLNNLADALEDATAIPYTDLQDFPQSTVVSHSGRFLAGRLSGVSVILQQGRCHLYEGKSPGETCMGVRVMAELGIGSLVLTNAAGSLNPLFPAGSLMLIDDHINFTARSPLTGANEDSWGLRFPDMSRLYDPELLRVFENTAMVLGMRVEKGVYICVPGPQLETRAETRMYRTLGADAAGMSTALEAIAAHHMGVRVAGISCLTNQNLPDCMDEATIEDIIAVAEKAGTNLARLLRAALPSLAELGKE
jgi:purine-nucleoside phosphorylase